MFDCFLTSWSLGIVVGVVLGCVSRSNTSRLNDDLSDIHSIMKQNINEVDRRALLCSKGPRLKTLDEGSNGNHERATEFYRPFLKTLSPFVNALT